MENKWFNSSSDPRELSLTIKGLMMMYVPIILAVIAVFAPSIEQSVVIDWIDKASLIVASVMILYGLGRKVYFWIKKFYN